MLVGLRCGVGPGAKQKSRVSPARTQLTCMVCVCWCYQVTMQLPPDDLMEVRAVFKDAFDRAVVAGQGKGGARANRNNRDNFQSFCVVNKLRRQLRNKGPTDPRCRYATAVSGRVWTTQPHWHGKQNPHVRQRHFVRIVLT